MCYEEIQVFMKDSGFSEESHCRVNHENDNFIFVHIEGFSCPSLHLSEVKRGVFESWAWH